MRFCAGGRDIPKGEGVKTAGKCHRRAHRGRIGIRKSTGGLEFGMLMVYFFGCLWYNI